MGFRLSRLVKRIPRDQLRGLRRALLQELADRARDDDPQPTARPSVPALAAALGVANGSVTRSLGELLHDGWIGNLNSRIGGRALTTVWRINIARLTGAETRNGGPPFETGNPVTETGLTGSESLTVGEGNGELNPHNHDTETLTTTTLNPHRRLPEEPLRTHNKNPKRESARARVAAGAAPSLSNFLEMEEIQKAAAKLGMPPAILRDCLQKFVDRNETRKHTPAAWKREAIRWMKREQFDPPRQTPAERPWKRHDHREAERIHFEAMNAALAAEAREIQGERVDPEPTRTPEQKQAARSGLQAVRNLIAGVALAKPEDEPE